VFAVKRSAEPRSVRALRAGIRNWLTGLERPADDRDDVVLAVSEAFEIAVAHAYARGPSGVVELSGGVVEIFGHVEAAGQLRRVVLRVRDHGRWRPVPADPGHRGHGFKVMRECMDQVWIAAAPGGRRLEQAWRS
jgi:anti-sigma regulatory factor (Ser/Thr protein kinase)